MGSGYSKSSDVSRLALGKQVMFPSYVGTTLKVHPPGASLIPGHGVLFELGIDLVDPSVDVNVDNTQNTKFDRIAHKLETHFSGRAFEDELLHHLLCVISDEEMAKTREENRIFLEYDIQPLPKQMGLRPCGRVEVTMRRNANAGGRHLGIASYNLCIPLVLVSFSTDDDDDSRSRWPPYVPLADIGLNVAASVQWMASGGGLVPFVEDHIYNARLEVNIPYMNFIGLGRMDVGSVPSRSRKTQTTKKERRPSPAQSATQFDAGKRMRGNDGNPYVVVQTSNGTKRWVRTA